MEEKEKKMPKGQTPKPSQIKRLEGNRRQRGLARITDDPQGVGWPQMPARLTEEEQRLWMKVVASLPVGLLTQADDSALETFAIEWAKMREADAMIKKTGLLVQSPVGPVRNPLLVVYNNAVKNMISLGTNLGLSPVARARLAAPNAASDDPMELLLGPDEDPNGAWSTLPKTKQ
jgi:P27 family predicted phage terminase small subunit